MPWLRTTVERRRPGKAGGAWIDRQWQPPLGRCGCRNRGASEVLLATQAIHRTHASADSPATPDHANLAKFDACGGERPKLCDESASAATEKLKAVPPTKNVEPERLPKTSDFLGVLQCGYSNNSAGYLAKSAILLQSGVLREIRQSRTNPRYLAKSAKITQKRSMRRYMPGPGPGPP